MIPPYAPPSTVTVQWEYQKVVGQTCADNQTLANSANINLLTEVHRHTVSDVVDVVVQLLVGKRLAEPGAPEEPPVVTAQKNYTTVSADIEAPTLLGYLIPTFFHQWFPKHLLVQTFTKEVRVPYVNIYKSNKIVTWLIDPLCMPPNRGNASYARAIFNNKVLTSAFADPDPLRYL